jgi:glycine dehydrogenase subunit 1
LDYTPHKNNDIDSMREFLGLSKDDLVPKDMPREMFYKGTFDIEGPFSEMDLRRHFKDIISKNTYQNYLSFLGAGIYDHYIPAPVKNLANRSEFVTAYTPYQAEMSQGILQSIYEYQTCTARLFGMDMSNASLYNGAHALFESVKIAVNYTKRKKVLISSLLHPEYAAVIKTYLQFADIEFVMIDFKNGLTSLENLKNLLDENTACVVLSNPNFFGMIEDIEVFAKEAKNKGALTIVSVYPISLGILKSPGECGADIVTAEGQSLGLEKSFGGSVLGMFACKSEFARFMPGRIVGRTTDKKGKSGFVLTLQAREQHIRREKALSNICSNHAWCALNVLIYLSCMGDKGLEDTANTCVDRAHYFANELEKTGKVSVVYKKGFFNEFILKLDDKLNFDEVNLKLKEKGIILGLPLKNYIVETCHGMSLQKNNFNEFSNCWLVSVTEKKEIQDLDKVVKIIQNLV